MPKEKRQPYKLSDEYLEVITDSLDDTAGYLIKGSTLKYWIERIVDEEKVMNMRAENELALAARKYIDIDDEVHCASDEEKWTVIEERAARYTEARKTLILLINRSIEGGEDA